MSSDRQVTMFWIEKDCCVCGHQMYSDGDKKLCPNRCANDINVGTKESEVEK